MHTSAMWLMKMSGYRSLLMTMKRIGIGRGIPAQHLVLLLPWQLADAAEVPCFPGSFPSAVPVADFHAVSG